MTHNRIAHCFTRTYKRGFEEGRDYERDTQPDRYALGCVHMTGLLVLVLFGVQVFRWWIR